MDSLYSYSPILVAFVALGIVMATSEIGWQIGVRVEGRGGNNITALEQSLLGLLALMIGFTFAMSLTRFESRREAVLIEANSIGTTVLRARLLPEPHRTKILGLLREYTQMRVDYIPSGKSFAEVPAIIDRSNAIHEALWQQAKAAAAKDNNMVPTGLFIQTLNDVIDNQAKRLAALRNSIPSTVLLSLFGVAAIACGFAGYASGLEPRRTRPPVYLMGVLICGVMFVILDLDRPNSGFITVSQQPMIDTAASIAAFSD